MADTTIIAAKVSVDTAAATKSVKDLKNEIKLLEKEFQNAAGGSVEQQNAYKKLKAAQDELAKSTKELKEHTKDTGEHFKTLKENMGALGSPLKTASEGVNTLSTSFKALLANPVVLVIAAIVAALAFLYKSFTNTAAGGEKMEQVFAGIKAVVSSVLDSIFKLGGAIIKLFKGDFKGAVDDASGAINGLINNAVDAYNAVSKLTAQAQQLRKEQAANDIDQAKRATELAKLREQSTDESIPVAKRKAALLELQKAAREDAVKDLDLAKRTAENNIALLSIGTDAAKKNFAEIAKIRVEQIQKEAESANELRRIGKQITAADKQEIADRKAAATAANEEAKKRREELFAFNQQLNKLQQDNALALIKDGYAKETQALENKIKDEENALKKQFQDGKLTRKQFEQLKTEEAISAANQRQALVDKHNEDLAKKEIDFQKELLKITEKTRLDGITDINEKERVQLQIGYEEKLQDAIARYKGDAVKLQQIKQALDAELKAQQDALDEKNRIENAKKALDALKDDTTGIINDPKAAFQAKQDALDAEQAQFKAAFDAKIITEKEYNNEVKQLDAARSTIRKKELQEQSDAANASAGLLEGLADAIGKNTAAGKALAIAAATIKALQTEITIIAGLSEVGPFGFIAGIAAAAAVGVGLFNTIKQIEDVPVPGQSSGGAATPSPLAIPVAPLSPQQTSTKLDQASINGIGSAIPSSRAYVLDADVKNNAERDARLTRAARLGG